MVEHLPKGWIVEASFQLQQLLRTIFLRSRQTPWNAVGKVKNAKLYNFCLVRFHLLYAAISLEAGAYERREAARRSAKLPYICSPILCRI